MSPTSIPTAIGAILSLLLGCFVLFKNSRSEANWAFSGTCFSLFFWLAPYSIAYSTQDVKIALITTRIACTSVVLFAPFLYHFIIAQFNINDERFRLHLTYLTMAVLVFGFLCTNLFLSGVYRYPWGYYSRAGLLHPIQVLFTSAIWLRCIVLLYRTAQKKNNQSRDMARFVFFSVAAIFPANLDYLPKYGINYYPFGFSFAVLYVLLVSYAILRYRLLNIQLVLRKGVAYSILAACITSTYLLVVLITEKTFEGFLGYRSLLVTSIVGFVVALSFVPLKNWVQQFVDRYFFKKSPEELAEENEQLRRQVERTERMKAVATLAAGMAHEIKNPLASIKTFAEYLPEKYDDPAFREKFAKIMGQEVDKMNALIQRLLDFAKPSPPQLGEVKACQAIKETLEFIHSTLLKKQIQVETHFAESDTIAADAAQLKQVFLNILLNSVEAMDQAGRISISTVRENGHLQIAFADTGPGIAPKDLQHVFDPFYTTKPNGTGLGLAVVHSIVRQHGGRINIQSAAGKGTVVRIDLPVNGGANGA